MMASIMPNSKALLAHGKALPLACCTDENKAMLTHAEQLALKLRYVLEERGITQTAIATACDASKQAVQGWKKTGRIAKHHLPKLAELTKLPLEWWLDPDAAIPPRLGDVLATPTPAESSAARASEISAKYTVIKGAAWPFKSVTPEQYDTLSPTRKAAVEEIILGMTSVEPLEDKSEPSPRTA